MFDDFVYEIVTLPIFVFYIVLGLTFILNGSILIVRYRKRAKIMFSPVAGILLLLFATSLAYQTSVHSISAYSCLGGLFGFFVLPIIALLDTGFSVWKWGSEIKTQGIANTMASDIGVKVLTYLMVIIVSLRSGVNCTV